MASLTAAKARRLLSRHNTLATHVYDAVPLAEDWSTTQVIGELVRQGRRTDKRVIDSVLHQLEGDGLIQHIGTGWRKVAVKLPPKKEPLLPAEPTTSEEKPMSAAETLLAIAEDLASHAQRAKALAEEGAQIAARVEAVAAEVEDELAAVNTDVERLRQLKSLLREI